MKDNASWCDCGQMGGGLCVAILDTHCGIGSAPISAAIHNRLLASRSTRTLTDPDG